MDARVLVIEHETHAGLDLMAAGLGPQVQVLRPYRGDRLPDPSELDQHAGMIVLGGSMGAWDDDVAPWLPATRTLIADAVRRQLPTLGICLGAQLLAAACGGAVEPGERGLEVGAVTVTPLAAARADPFFADPFFDSARPVDQPVWQYHFDAVTRLPADAELLVTGDRYPNQGFRVGSTAWAVQYHPEVSLAEFSGWVDSGVRSGELATSAQTVLEPVRAGQAVQQRLARTHARAFLDIIRGC